MDIYDKITKLNTDGFDHITISIKVYNLIYKHIYFYSEFTEDVSIGSKFFVGNFGKLKCFVDLTVFDNMVILSFSDDEVRDRKIDSILENSNKVNQKVIMI
jgi:hypothetical protein